MTWLFVIYFIAEILLLVGQRRIALGLGLFLWVASILFFIFDISTNVGIRI